ncbi:diacylglycerol/lipid kinase family protein [Tepidamorphus sp. 3E244]|uniref:diacylglycerol/lipid kinase family protein n=1 Tax=Tepidamorphus sp. 3E244 TaxID=3385498 RepID=UPI0038FCE601
MRVKVILNREAGSLRTEDVNEYARFAAEAFRKSGHDPDVDIIEGKTLTDALDAACKDPEWECVSVCGGDGSISTAAGTLWKCGKVLAVIPAGTMNLFARTLQIPLDIHEAVEAVAAGRVVDADIATVNGDAFVHQFSVGLHSKMVESRKAYPYSSRASKIFASVRGAFDAVTQAPRFTVEITPDNAQPFSRTLSVLACANNRYGEGHLPYADKVDGGELGLYLAPPLSVSDSVSLAADVFMGAWAENGILEETAHQQVDVKVLRASRRAKCVRDGELYDLPREITIKSHPGELKVLVPQQSTAADT